MHLCTLFLLFQLLEVSQLDITSLCLWVYGAFKLPKPLMPLRRVTIVLSQFPLGKWIVLLTSDCGRQFIKSSESKERDDGVWCCGPPKLNGFGTVAPYVGGTLGVTKVAAVSVEELRYSVAWCNVSLERGQRCVVSVYWGIDKWDGIGWDWCRKYSGVWVRQNESSLG